MSMLEQNTKFSFSNHRGTKKFGEGEFFAWTSNNFYRTSYNDMGHKVSHQSSVLVGSDEILSIADKIVLGEVSFRVTL